MAEDLLEEEEEEWEAGTVRGEQTVKREHLELSWDDRI